MSNYTKATNFASKDALTTGNPLKTLSGTELDDEFNAIQAANNTKANSSNAVLTGVPTAPTAAADTSTTQVATTAFVTTEAALKADLAGAAFTGAITTTSTVDGVDIATRDGVLTTTATVALEALPKAGGALTGAVTTTSTFDGRDVSVDGTKLDTLVLGTTVQAYDATIVVDADIGTTVQAYDVDTTKNDTSNTFTGAQIGTVTALTSSSGTLAVNLATNNNFSHTTSENTTLGLPSNPVAGQSGVITITQGATARTLAYNTFWKFAGGSVPTLTATVGAVDVFAYNVESATRATAQLIGDVK